LVGQEKVGAGLHVRKCLFGQIQTGRGGEKQRKLGLAKQKNCDSETWEVEKPAMQYIKKKGGLEITSRKKLKKYNEAQKNG